jgi:hypothetical protein
LFPVYNHLHNINLMVMLTYIKLVKDWQIIKSRQLIAVRIYKSDKNQL